MDEEDQDDFSKYEDEIISLLNKLSTTIDTFNTLSRDQAEKAILETNLKINNCKEILDKMEYYVKNIEDNDEEINKVELNKKILNYKSEYHEILNKFSGIQDNYINKKTENALLEKDIEENLVDEEEDKNKDKKNKILEKKFIIDGELNEIKKNKDNKKEVEKKKDDSKKNNEISLISVTNNNQNVLGHNNTQALKYSLNPKLHDESDEAFNQINKDYDSKKKKTVLICVVICVLIFFIIILSATLSRK